MGIFGNQNIEANSRTVEGQIEGTPFTCLENGIGESITVYEQSRDQSNKWSCALYRFSDGVLIQYTEEKDLGPEAGFQWTSFNFITPLPTLVAGTAYLITAWGNNLDCLVKRGALAGSYRDGHPYDYPNFANPHVKTATTGPYSIYCTYSLGELPMGLGLKLAPKGGIGRPQLGTGGNSFGG